MNDFLGIDLAQAGGSISEVLQDPGSNFPLAMLLVAAITVLVLVLLVVAIMFFRDDEEDEEESSAEAMPPARPSRPALPPRKPAVRLPLGASILAWVLVLMLVWLGGGALTSRDDVCVSCHPKTVHTAADKKDPHRRESCVSCHESGGIVGQLTYGLPSRATHLFLGFSQAEDDPQRLVSAYGTPISSAACVACHKEEIRGTLRVAEKGVMVSHKEPLAAGATCLDCHIPVSGSVSGVTAGMTPCLRCHNGAQAPSQCDTCHKRDIGFAARGSGASVQFGPREIIETPDCGGCHPQDSCDACHGIRLPHSKEFRNWSHARQGAQDVWFNAGAMCSKCHYEGRRPCTRCHEAMSSHGGRSWAYAHQGTVASSCTCHDRKAVIAGRNFCELCHEAGTGKRK